MSILFCSIFSFVVEFFTFTKTYLHFCSAFFEIDRDYVEANPNGWTDIDEDILVVTKKTPGVVIGHPVADCPVVMTADWNEHDEHALFNELYKTFKNARFTASITDRGATFNNFGANTDYLRIDHVFYKGFASCSKFAVERRAWNGHAYISDHYPIYATLHF